MKSEEITSLFTQFESKPMRLKELNVGVQDLYKLCSVTVNGKTLKK